mmetsp:Transcript_126710/g.370261  ORF Transcript_126710/g.370261 Transcript_126710/m.370261 type:complete len:214 (-) Transcript_126710:221-862(-)
MKMTDRIASQSMACMELAKIVTSFASPAKVRKTRSRRIRRSSRKVLSTEIPESALLPPASGVSSQASNDPSNVQAKSKGPHLSQQKSERPLALIRRAISTQKAARKQLSIAVMYAGGVPSPPESSTSTPMNAALRRMRTPKTMLPEVVLIHGFSPGPPTSARIFCWIDFSSSTTGCGCWLTLVQDEKRLFSDWSDDTLEFSEVRRCTKFRVVS